MRARAWTGVLSFGLLLGGCDGVIADPRSVSEEGADATGDRSAMPFGPGVCDADGPIDVGDSPLRRLTTTQHRYAARDLLGLGAVATADALAPLDVLVDGDSGGFAATSSTPDAEVVRTHLTVAEGLAAAFVARRLDDELTCDPASTACVRPLIERLGRRAFRRRLTRGAPDAELERYVSLYETTRDSFGVPAAIETVVTALLSSPGFLYHAEEVDVARAGDELVPLTEYALASKLSFLLWSSIPDDTLLDAAEAGDLEIEEGLATHVRRMIADERFGRTIESFYAQWLRLDELENVERDDPAWNDGLRASMRAETMRFVEHVMRADDPRRVDALLTARYTFADQALADLYGIPAPAEPFGRVELDGQERIGLLTHAGLLTELGTIFPEVHRGLFVRERLLCDPPPPPPPDVPPEQSAYRLSTAPCNACHVRMDPIGFGFDRYDSLGRYRTEDASGAAIDDSGEVIAEDGTLEDVAGTFSGPAELAERLAASPRVHWCVSVQWWRYAAGRHESRDETCALSRFGDAVTESGGDLKELLVTIAVSEAFGSRSARELSEGGER